MENIEQEIHFKMFKCSIVICYDFDFNKEKLGVHNYVHAATKFIDGEPSEIHLNCTTKLAIVHIVHELIHCLRDLFNDYLGIRSISEAEDEVLPYGVEYAMSEVYKFCCKNKIDLCYLESEITP